MNLFFFVVLAGVFTISIAEDVHDAFVVGEATNSSVLLHSQNVQRGSTLWGKVRAELVWPKEGEARTHNITNIVAEKMSRSWASMNVLEGGPGSDHVKLQFNSWFLGFNYSVKIFGFNTEYQTTTTTPTTIPTTEVPTTTTTTTVPTTTTESASGLPPIRF